jgi:alpha-amylase
VSYKIHTRSGDEKEFAEMTRRCNAVGVRIYADAVINHMAYTHGYGTAGSQSITPMLSYPAVPYSRIDFNDACNINNYNDNVQVRNCLLSGLPDLNQGVEWVRGKIAEYMNHLIDLGVGEIFSIISLPTIFPEI